MMKESRPSLNQKHLENIKFYVGKSMVSFVKTNKTNYQGEGKIWTDNHLHNRNMFFSMYPTSIRINVCC